MDNAIVSVTNEITREVRYFHGKSAILVRGMLECAVNYTFGNAGKWDKERNNLYRVWYRQGKKHTEHVFTVNAVDTDLITCIGQSDYDGIPWKNVYENMPSNPGKGVKS